VVFKRLDSSYRPGRRSNAWRKYKHRRRETLAVSAWAPGDRQPDTFYLTRIADNGQPSFAGAVQLGLDRAPRERLRRLVLVHDLAAPRRRRRRIRAVAPGISLVVDSRGVVGGTLRDALIRDVLADDDRA
jgi:bifunctional non-homologous end joining protein LigD